LRWRRPSPPAAGGGGSSSSSSTYVIDEGGGNSSSVVLGTSTFKVTKSNGYKQSGSLTRLDNGFLGLTKQSSTDPNEGDPIPSTYYGFELPGLVLFVVDPNVEGPGEGLYVQSIVGVNKSGSCPMDGASLLAMATTDHTWDSQANLAYGDATFDLSGGATTLNALKLDQVYSGSGDSSESLNNMTCSGGVATGDEGSIQFTSSGVGVYDHPGASGFLLLPTDDFGSAANLGDLINKLHATGRHFYGLLIQPYSTLSDGNYDTTEVAMLAAAGSYPGDALAAAPFINVVFNEVSDPGSLTLGSSDLVSNPMGMLDASSTQTDTGRFVATRVNGRWVIYGLIRSDIDGNQSTGDTYDFQTVFLIEENVTYTPEPTVFSGTERHYGFQDSGISYSVTYDPDGGVYLADDPGDGIAEWGSVTDLGNGFVKLTRQQATDLAASSGHTSSALEIRDSLLLTFDQDQGSDRGKMSFGFNPGSCPGVGESTYYAVVAAPDSSQPDLTTVGGLLPNIYGDAQIYEDAGSDTVVLGPTWNLIADKTLIAPPTLVGEPGCLPGTGLITGVNTPDLPIQLFNNGAAFLSDSVTGANDLLLFPQPTSPITPRSSVNYAGWASSPRCMDPPFCTDWESDSAPLWGTGQGSGKIKAGTFTDVFSNKKDPQSGTLTVGTSSSATGLFDAGTVNIAATTVPIRFMVMEDPNTGKHFIYGVFYDSAANTATNSNWQQIFLYER
jgi:hypothetical protein